MSLSQSKLAYSSKQKSDPRAIGVEDRRHFVRDIDYLVTSVSGDRIQHVAFRIDDIPYRVTRARDSETGGVKLCISAMFGHLPYSIENKDARDAILAIIEASASLFHVRFGVDHTGRIFAAGIFGSEMLTMPDFLFYPLTRFLQEAQPFMTLIGAYLD